MRAKFYSYIQFIKRFLVFLAGSLLILSLLRLIWFITYNRGDEWQNFSNDILRSFYLGLRFDLSAFSYWSLPPLVLFSFWSLLGPTKTPQLLRSIFFQLTSLWMLTATFILVVDFIYFSYFQDHINILIFGFITDDTQALLKTFWNNYPVLWILLFFILLQFLYHRFITKWLIQQPELTHNFRIRAPHYALPFVFIFLLALSARGSLGLFPLGIMDVAISQNQFVNQIPLNGIHALGRAIEARLENQESSHTNLRAFSLSPEKAWSDYLGIPIEQLPPDPLVLLSRTTPHQPDLGNNRPHIVFFLMESMSNHWISFHSKGLNLLGDLEKHFSQDFLFRNIMPSSGATIGSLAALLINMPHRSYGPFLTESSYLSVPFKSAPARVLKTLGYTSHFVYGGNPGWRDVAKFAIAQGFDQIHGEHQIIDRLKIDSALAHHDWGIYDEFVFNYTQEILKSSTTPQFIFVLTTTNHPPYTTPNNYQALPLHLPKDLSDRLTGDPRLNLDRLKVYQYSNHQLGKFMSWLKSSSLGDRTLLAATGDHSFYILPYSTEELFHKWSVPLYVYFPSFYKKDLKTPINLKVYGSHFDIFPTLFSHSFSDLKYDSLGSDLFDPNLRHSALHTNLMAFNDLGAVIILDDKSHSSLNWNDQGLLSPTENTDSHQKLANYYRSLMGVADLYFEQQKQDSR